MRGSKAQAGIEFMICVAFLIMIMILLTIYSVGKQSEETSIEAKLGSEKICWQVSNLINTAMYARGYHAEFSLPAKINGLEYNLTVANNTVMVDYNGHSCIYGITVINISYKSSGFATPAPFYNLSGGGDFSIDNTDTGIVICNRSASGC